MLHIKKAENSIKKKEKKNYGVSAKAENPTLIGWDLAFDPSDGFSDDAINVWLHHQNLTLITVDTLPDSYLDVCNKLEQISKCHNCTNFHAIKVSHRWMLLDSLLLSPEHIGNNTQRTAQSFDILVLRTINTLKHLPPEGTARPYMERKEKPSAWSMLSIWLWADI